MSQARDEHLDAEINQAALDFHAMPMPGKIVIRVTKPAGKPARSVSGLYPRRGASTPIRTTPIAILLKPLDPRLRERAAAAVASGVARAPYPEHYPAGTGAC
jgi:hypothetical protein